MAEAGDTMECPSERLFDAIVNQNVDIVRSILEEHPETVNKRWETARRHAWGMITPLMEACYAGSLDIARALLEFGADVCASGYSLNSASISNLNQLLANNDGRLYGGHGSFDDLFPLFIAAQKKHFSLIEELVCAGADINQTTFVGWSALHRTSMTFNESIEPPYINDIPVSPGVSTIKLLLKHGADIHLKDRDGMTPFHWACRKSRQAYVATLLEYGADVNMEDNFGITPLQYAALSSYAVTETVLETAKRNLSNESIIEAYEIVALCRNCPSASWALHKATRMRTIHNVQKRILEPMACYGFVKEWVTSEELKEFQYDHEKINLQALLARERIFNGKYFDLMDRRNMEALTKSRLSTVGEIQQHHLELVKRSNDYLYFGDTFTGYNCILASMCLPVFVMHNDLIANTMDLVIECCLKIQEDLNATTKPAMIWELNAQFKQTMLYSKFFITHLMLRFNDECNPVRSPADQELAKKTFVNVWKLFPFLSCSFIGYKAPLAHVLFDYTTCAFWSNRIDQHDGILLEMFLNFGLDLDLTDSDGNTLLHVIVSSRPQAFLVETLLEVGIHADARNKWRQTALDIVKGPNYKECIKDEITEILEEQDKELLPLKCMAAMKVRDLNISCNEESLPKSLIAFVDIH